MELLICGTAAAEGWPAVFCSCGPCQEARRLGGRNLRSRAAYMLGDRVRIDFGPDGVLHQHAYGLDYARLEHLLVTHSHDDHWFPPDISYRRPGFSIVPEDRPLHLWANAKTAQRFTAIAGDDWARYRLQFHQLELWQPFDLGQGLEAVAIPAAHDPGEQCINFILRQDGKSLLIGHDTGWYGDATWDYLGAQTLDLVLMDCTYGKDDSNRGHLGCPWVVRARDELAKRGALASDARVIATHFSHNGGWLYDELQEYFRPHGIEVAYDGMRLSV